MNKQALTGLMKEKDFTYPVFLRRAKSHTATTQWGMGVLEPYSLEPYRMELSGFNRGKMLKKPSEPARNRYRYSLDAAGRIIHRIEYTKCVGAPGKESWLHLDDFYEHCQDHVVRYVFSTASDDENGDDVSLTRIVWADIGGGKVVRTYRLENDSREYTEESYQYDNDQIVAVRLIWPEGPYPERNFRIVHEAGSIRIVELGAGKDKKEIQIYPAK